MITRRSVSLLVLALALLAPATAQADKAKPKSSVPKIIILLTDGLENKTIKPTITVTFDPPKGTTAAKACKGKIEVSAPIGQKIVKKKTVTLFAHNIQQLRTVGGVCTASPTLKLPAVFLDQSVKFTAVFKGNDVVKKFKKTSKLKVAVTVLPVPQTPTPTPAKPALHQKTYWRAQVEGTGIYFDFRIYSDDSVKKISQTGDMPYLCPGHLPANVLHSYFTPFNFVGDSASVTDIWTDNSGQYVQTTFKFDLGATTGTGSMTGFGTLLAQASLGGATELATGCATNGTIPLKLRVIQTL